MNQKLTYNGETHLMYVLLVWGTRTQSSWRNPPKTRGPNGKRAYSVTKAPKLHHIQVNLPSQQYFVFWCLLNLQSKRISFSIFSIFWMFHVKIRQKRDRKTQNFINHAGTLWILSILTGFRVRARYHFISVYMFAIALNMVRCFARFLCFPVFVFCQSIAISKLIKHISVANEIFLSSYVDLYSVHS